MSTELRTVNGRDLPSVGPARILVVDDQPANLQVVGSVLGKLGHEIIPAMDGPSALKRMGLRQPDLILLDVLMPEMDGYEVCKRLLENPEWKNIPVIFLSAADDKDFIVRALEIGGVDYITKPFNQAELISRVRTHLALKAARDRLTQLAEDKDELLGILAHDLKNHLGGVQMSARLLSDNIAQTGNPKQQQLSENICHSTGQLLAFVKQFLANSAVDHRIEIQPSTANLSEAVARVVEDYREAARQKNLELRLQLPKDPAWVCADRGALSQIIDNLLSNALKFSPPGKLITATVSPVEKSFECRIQDEGPGLTAEDKTQMFRRYRRLSARPTGGEPSTGLGLSIVKKLVQAMQGQLICESTPGKGATFAIRLPKPAASKE
jgi:two-component system sensor histidine kinase/response regulator